jgi:hypothetical protein
MKIQVSHQKSGDASKWIALFVMASGCCLTFWILFSFFSWIGRPTPPSAADERHHQELDAYYRAVDAVRNGLKTPASARFSGIEDPGAGISLPSSGAGEAWGWVDAQNGFGANLRDRWSVELDPNGAHTVWTATRVRIGDQDLATSP